MADYDNYRKMLIVNKHRLDDELEVHADILERIGNECVRLEARAIELKDALARKEAQLTEELREEDDRKVTKDQIEARVVRHRERISAFESHQMARVEHQRWERLYEAWKARDFAVRKLADLFGTHYFANDPVVNRERERRNNELDERRAELRRASAQASSDGTSSRRRIVE